MRTITIFICSALLTRSLFLHVYAGNSFDVQAGLSKPCALKGTAARVHITKNERAELNVCWKSPKNETRCLPTHYMIGVEKTGTTELWSRIVYNFPEFSVPNVAGSLFDSMKEPYYWGERRHQLLPHEPKGHLAEEWWDSYTSLWQQVGKGNLMIDGSTNTWYDRGAPEKISELQPAAKYILMMRNPADTVYSSFEFHPNPNKTVEEFHDLVRDEINRFNACHATMHALDCIRNPIYHEGPGLHLGLYSEYLEHWYKHVRPENILTIYQRELSDVALMKRVREFFGLPPLDFDIPTSSHSQPKTAKKRDMLPETRVLLESFFRPFNARLATMTGDKDPMTWMTS